MSSKVVNKQLDVRGGCSDNNRLDPPGQIGRCLDVSRELEESKEEESESGFIEFSLRTDDSASMEQQYVEEIADTKEPCDEYCNEQSQILQSGKGTLNYIEGDSTFGPDFKDQVQSVANVIDENEDNGLDFRVTQKTDVSESGNAPLVQAVAVEMALASETSDNIVRNCTLRKHKCFLILAALVLILTAVVLTVLLLFVLKSDEHGNTEFPRQSSTILPTESPTLSPMMTARAASILSYIRNITMSTKNISYPPNVKAAPEELAVQWLVDNDPLQLSVDDYFERFRIQQRYALLVLWFQTNGNSWTSQAGWLDFEDECSWYGVACEGSNRTVRGITKITLDRDNSALGNNLRNRIPEDLFLLTNLTVLDLSHNSITGQIPDAIGKLTQLDRLSLASMDLSGSLPSSIGNLVKLKELYLYSNLLTSTLPVSIGDMTSITIFDVSENNFQGSIPRSIVNWMYARQVHFFSNKMLGGQIPDELWSLTKLTDLSLRDMGLTSTISSLIGNLSLLTEFRIHRNQLTSTLPNELGLLTNMRIFSVSQNSLEGTIPASLSNWTNIQEAYFDLNNFTGSIPKELCLYLPTDLEADCNFKVECLCCTFCAD